MADLNAWGNTANFSVSKGRSACSGISNDYNNDVLGFFRDRTGHLPSIPGIGGTPGTPGFGGKPGRPGFSGVPGRPGYGGWSNYSLANYFN